LGATDAGLNTYRTLALVAAREEKLFSKRELNRQSVLADNPQKELQRIEGLLQGEIVARGQIDLFANPVFNGLAENHLVVHSRFSFEWVNGRPDVPFAHALTPEP
jgi:hypothetical protein